MPNGYAYLTGDNKEASKDSKTYGPVPYGLIESRVFLRVNSICLHAFLNNQSSDKLYLHNLDLANKSNKTL